MSPGDAESREIRAKVIKNLRRYLEGHTKLEAHIRIPSEAREAEIHFEHRQGKVALRGIVPDQSYADSLVAAISLAFATSGIDNNLQIDPDVRQSEWLDDLLRAVFPLAMTTWLDLKAENGRVTLRGRVRTDDEEEILDEQMREHFNYTTRVINHIKKRGNSG